MFIIFKLPLLLLSLPLPLLPLLLSPLLLPLPLLLWPQLIPLSLLCLSLERRSHLPNKDKRIVIQRLILSSVRQQTVVVVSNL
jgi:hypothetical protein